MSHTTRELKQKSLQWKHIASPTTINLSRQQSQQGRWNMEVMSHQ